MKVYEFQLKMAGLHKVSAEVAGQVCVTLANSTGGLTPKRLVEASRDEQAPLHAEFEWDDTVAGELYREQQAQTLIQHLVIVESDSEKERQIKLVKKEQEETKPHSDPTEKDTTTHDRGFVSTGERNNRYVELFSALTNEVWRKNLLDAARRDARTFIAKYHRLEELSKIIDDMNDFLGA